MDPQTTQRARAGTGSETHEAGHDASNPGSIGSLSAGARDAYNVLDAIPAGVLIVQGGDVVHASSGAARLFRLCHADDLLGRPLSDLVRTSGGEAEAPPGDLWMAASFTMPDGSACDGAVHHAYVDWQGAPALQVMAITTDVRSQPFLALVQSEERYRRLVEDSPDAIYVHCEGVVRFANQAAAHMLGLARAEDLVGRHVLGHVHPDYREIVARRIEAARHSAAPFPGVVERLRTADGQDFYVHITGSHVTWEGQPAVQVMLRDVSERVRAAGILRRRKELYRHIIDQSPNGICLLRQGTIVFANARCASILGVPTPQALRDQPLARWLSSDQYAWLEAATQAVADGTAVPVYEGRLCGEDRVLRDVEARLTAVMYGDEHLTQAFLYDHTERKQVQAALERRDAILSAVALAAELLLRDPHWQGAIQEVLQALGEAAQVSRVYVFRRRDVEGISRIDHAYEWVAPGVAPHIDSGQFSDLALSEAGFGRWLDALARGETIHGVVGAFPESERPLLEAQQIRSLLVVPVQVEGDWWGFVGLDECSDEREWQASERAAIASAARLLGAAIQRERTEEALRAAECVAREVIENSRDVAYRVSLAGGCFDYVSSASQALLGFAAEELAAMGLEHAQHRIHPDDRDRCARVIAEAVKDPTGADHEPPTEYRWLHADGRYRWYSDVHQAVRDESGRVTAVVGTMRDITAEKRAARALARSEERFRALFENIGDAFLLFGPTFRLRECDARGREMLGADLLALSADMPNEFLRSFVLGTTDLSGLLGEALRTGTPQRHASAMLLRAGDGADDALYLDLVAYRVRFGGQPYVALLCRDISEMRRLESALRQAQHLEALGRLASGVAHDFGNVLAVIGAQCDLLETMLPHDSVAGREVRTMRSVVDGGTSISRQLIAFSRDEPMVEEALHVNLLVRNAEGLLRKMLPAGVELYLGLSPVPLYTRGDAGQLTRMLVNLVLNAGDATSAGGQVRVATAAATLEADGERPSVPPGRYVLLSVADTGVGISSDDLARIFEPFYTTKRAQGRLGLGLSVVYGIALKSHAHLAVDSVAGEGTTFSIYLPRLDEPDADVTDE